MENCTIRDNTATASGPGVGGLHFSGTASANPPAGFVANTLVVRNSTFYNNTSAGDGGAIGSITFEGTLLVQNSTITLNSAQDDGGGIVILSTGGSMRIQNSTIVGNAAQGSFEGGGGVVRLGLVAGSITLENSIVSGNPILLPATFTRVPPPPSSPNRARSGAAAASRSLPGAATTFRMARI